ncbi:MAG: carboxypeptidase-like regulatory domain-containing protein, partial [Deltaproteobacteria bacterium]|nr:carboxypeptidase-like regulatory domain-containing protein [Deltaproteobacteria bacterium]
VQGQSTSNIDFSLETAGSISGTVTGSDDQPVADVWVTAYSAPCWNNWVGSHKTDANGLYTISGLSPGKIYLFADATYHRNQNYVNEWWNGVTGTTDCNTAMPITVVAGQNITTDFVLDQKFEVELVVKKVQKWDSSIITSAEIMIGDKFDGTLPDDITAITLTGPNGVLSSEITDFTYYSQWKEFGLVIPGEPEIGEYSVEVTSSDSATATDKDYQRAIRTIPIPDTSNFSPAEGAILNSKTPTFTWTPIEYNQVPVFYKMVVLDDQENWVFSSAREQNLFSCTIPDGLLEPGETYKWYVRVGDSSDWIKEDNRSNSAALTFTMAGTLAPHSSIPAIDPAQWAAVNWSRDDGDFFNFAIVIIDHDGVAYDGSSHAVTVTCPEGTVFPDGTAEKQMKLNNSMSPISAEYGLWLASQPAPGEYIFTVTDPDENSASAVDTLSINSLEPPDENSFTPSLKNPVAETITATFDNVDVNGVLYDDFNSYTSIDDLDYTKWKAGHEHTTIENQKMSVTLNGSIGRGNGGLAFPTPESINSIKADITVTDISMDSSAGGRIAGTFFHNGTGDISAGIYVRKNHVTYWVSEDIINEWETYEWDSLADGELMQVSIGQTVAVSIAWDGTKLTFDADGNKAFYTPAGEFTPPKIPYMSLLARMNLVTDTTPTFTWNPVAGANRYKIKIYSYDNKKVVWHGWTGNETSCKVPPGVLVPNAYYRFRIEARDAHNPLNIDNVSLSPGSSDDYYRFYTDSEEAVEPYIELDNSGVQVWNDELFGPHLSFWIKVHDAQGVPADIKSVKVIYPGGAEEFLYYYPGNTSNTVTGGIYRSTAYPATIESGAYSFRVEDLSGNIYTVNESLMVNQIEYPDKALMNPLLDESVNDTAVDFDWTDVPGTAFYRLEIYDTDYNRLYAFATTESRYSLPAGFLKEDKHYLYVVKTHREFLDQNVDNGSSSSWDRFGSREFMTSVITGGTESPSIDLMNKGAYICHTQMPDTGNSSYWLIFEAKVTDPDGVPGNIEKVEVYYPGSSQTLKLRYSKKINLTEAIYEGYEIYDNADDIPAGFYIFRVEDYDDEASQEVDDLVKNIIPLPANITPGQNSTVIGTTPTIDWDDVNGATRYRIRLYDGWDKPLQWSDYLAQSTHAFAPAVLSMNNTYSFKIYSYREQVSDVDLDNCSVNSLFYPQMPHFTTRADTDSDGVPDFQDAFPDDINEWLDTDSDGTGDNADTDDDNDGFADGADAFPKEATEWFDTDSDGIGNNADPDDDNDGYADGFDIRPTVADDPGGANYNCTTDTRRYTISGDISYAGPERSPIYVAIFDSAGLTTVLAETEIASPSGSGPWSYSITNVPARNQYYVEAFMDFNTDDALDIGEPEGIIGAFGIAAGMTGKDVELEIESSAVKPMPWIPLLLLDN